MIKIALDHVLVKWLDGLDYWNDLEHRDWDVAEVLMVGGCGRQAQVGDIVCFPCDHNDPLMRTSGRETVVEEKDIIAFIVPETIDK